MYSTTFQFSPEHGILDRNIPGRAGTLWGKTMQKHEIDRINELAHKAKTTGLTEAEIAERAELRRRYVADVRAALQDQLNHTIVQEPDGTRHPLLKQKETHRVRS